MLFSFLLFIFYKDLRLYKAKIKIHYCWVYILCGHNICIPYVDSNNPKEEGRNRAH